MTFSQKIHEAATEGAVLLKNERNTLPFTDSDTISVFGRCQINYYRSGTGSGGSVHVAYCTNLIDGLLRKKSSGHNPLINKELARVYKDWVKENPFDNGGGGWAAEPWNQKEMEITEKLAQDAAIVSNKALFVIGRTAGEEQDNRYEKGSFLLTDEETDTLKKICGAFEQVVVVLNVSNIIDMNWIKDPEFLGHITSVMYVWHGGMEGGNAAADLLCGVVTPSGKLTDTIAKAIDDYPTTVNFGNLERNFYKEDIYVGYRYFCTFAPKKVEYPFGYGLSYTQFSYNVLNAYDKKGKIFVTVDVKNVGKSYSGKEVIQIYFEAPQGKLGKPSRQLIAFAKTNVLKPGKSQKMVISFALNDMASYDDSGVTGHKSCFVLEEGDYFFYAGTDVESATVFKVDGKSSVRVIDTFVVESLEQAAAPTIAFERMRTAEKKIDGTFGLKYEKVPLSQIDLAERINNNLPEEIPFTGNIGLTFNDVKKKPIKLDAFIGQLNTEQLATLVRGEGMCSDKVTAGIASAFGGLSNSLNDYGIPVAGTSDGPSGIRRDNGDEASLMPIGTLLACSWNRTLVKELYSFEGRELVEAKIDTLLGPGMNIHRHPLNGRNFEYFSEDPLVTGEMACAVIEGLRKGGSSGTIKHFATNNQETNRHVVDAIVSERALREIYLRGFEMAVKKGKANSLMTTYAPLNGHWTGSNYDLVNTILHKEWNYKGLVMTDWWAELNDCVTGGKESRTNTANMVKARNDVYMIVDNGGSESNVYGDNIPLMLKEGNLTIAELQLCVKDILNYILSAQVSKRPLRSLSEIVEFKTLYSYVKDNCKVFKKGEMFSPSNDGTITQWIEIEEKGIYNIYAVFSKLDSSEVSQSICNILFDDRTGVAFDNRGTNGNVINVNVGRAKFEKGFYEVKLNHVKPGITVESVLLQKTGM